MSKTLGEIAQQLKDSSKKVQIIYAFNGVGKTRLSMEFKNLVSPHIEKSEGLKDKHILYYNAFTEDLFYWDNDLRNDEKPKLKIQPNDFTNWIFVDQGQDQNVVRCFGNYTNDKLMPKFNDNFSEVTFAYTGGNEEIVDNIKISKGEESCFIWSVFYSLLSEVIEVLNVSDEDERETDKFNNLEYVFIDDPVSSLDENHLIELALNLSQLIKNSDSDLKFIITTHNTLFYNVLYNELKNPSAYVLEVLEDKTFKLKDIKGDSNQNIFYHHFLLDEIKDAIENNRVEKYHFTLLRNLYEKVSSFLGYENWSELLPDDKKTYEARLMNFYSHRKLPDEEVKIPNEQEKMMIKRLYDNLIDFANFKKEKK